MFDPLLPLTTDADLLAMADDLIGSAIRRQTWLLVLDEERRLSPVVLPVLDGVPADADPRSIERLATTITGLVAEVEPGGSVVIVWERPGGADVRMQEADWIAGLAASGAPVRAQLVSSDDGVHVVDPAFAPLVAV